MSDTITLYNLDRREAATAILGPRNVLLRKMTEIFIVCGASYAAVYSLGLHYWLAAWVLIVATPVGMISPLVERWTRSSTSAANYLIAVIFAAVSSLVLLTGGLSSPSLMWLIVVPMTATIMNGPRWGLAWLPVVSIEVMLVGMCDASGYRFPQPITPAGMHVLTILSVIGLATSVFICVHVYHLHVSQANRQLHDQASHDALTGLYNYRAMVSLLEQIMRAPKDVPQLFALIMIDIDAFKSINDRFGHATGDHMLKEAARRIRTCVRNTDYVGRFGGEEFLCVLPTCPLPVAERIAENLRRAFEAHNEVHSLSRTHGDPAITISLGVACYDSSRDNDVFAVLSNADGALYEAKQTGRNKVCMATRESRRPEFVV